MAFEKTSGTEILFKALGINPREIQEAMLGVVKNIEAMKLFMENVDKRLTIIQSELEIIKQRQAMMDIYFPIIQQHFSGVIAVVSSEADAIMEKLESMDANEVQQVLEQCQMN